MKLPEHLGGHKGRTHTDSGVIEFFRDEHGCNTMVDVGCGPGGQVEVAKELGLEAHGIDGDWTVERSFDCEIVDFTQTKYESSQEFDLAWCVEFLEHVQEEYIPNYMPALQQAQYVVVTHALPGEPGHHHVNCQESDYWIEKFAKYGFNFSEKLTEQVRAASTMERDFVRRRGLVFVRA